MTKQITYDGWELEFFDKADNFRNKLVAHNDS